MLPRGKTRSHVYSWCSDVNETYHITIISMSDAKIKPFSSFHFWTRRACTFLLQKQQNWDNGYERSCARRLEIGSSIVPKDLEYMTLTSIARVSNTLHLQSALLSPIFTFFSKLTSKSFSLSLVGTRRLPGKDTIVEFKSCTSNRI